MGVVRRSKDTEPIRLLQVVKFWWLHSEVLSMFLLFPTQPYLLRLHTGFAESC